MWCQGRFLEDLGGAHRDMAVVSVVQKSWVAAVEGQSAPPPKQDGGAGVTIHTPTAHQGR